MKALAILLFLTCGAVCQTVEKKQVEDYRIISSPRATFPRDAGNSCVQGSVRLKITLLANGSIGTIVPVTRLPYGLTEQAIEAARRIVFLPKRVDGFAVPVTILREYYFGIY
jgi:outer membrane biosynthesis protein TonB